MTYLNPGLCIFMRCQILKLSATGEFNISERLFMEANCTSKTKNKTKTTDTALKGLMAVDTSTLNGEMARRLIVQSTVVYMSSMSHTLP